MLAKTRNTISEEKIEETQRLYDEIHQMEEEWPILLEKHKVYFDEYHKNPNAPLTRPAEVNAYSSRINTLKSKLEAISRPYAFQLVDEVREDYEFSNSKYDYQETGVREETEFYDYKVKVEKPIVKVDYENPKIQKMMKGDPNQWQNYLDRIEKENAPQFVEQEGSRKKFIVPINREAVTQLQEGLQSFIRFLIDKGKTLPIATIQQEYEDCKRRVEHIDTQFFVETSMTEEEWMNYQSLCRHHSL